MTGELVAFTTVATPAIKYVIVYACDKVPLLLLVTVNIPVVEPILKVQFPSADALGTAFVEKSLFAGVPVLT